MKIIGIQFFLFKIVIIVVLIIDISSNFYLFNKSLICLKMIERNDIIDRYIENYQ